VPNEDVKLKAQVYKDPRPAEIFEPFHERVRDHPPEWIYEVVRSVTMLNALVTFRAQAIGSENVPNGPVILAPNHASFMDHFFTGVFIRRHVQFMAKSQMFGRTPLSWIYSHGGVFPVRRGHHDEEAFTTAFTVLARGGAVGMYVEGGRSRNGEIGTEAKAGIGRLALESGAAVVPVAILGSHQVRNWKKLHFPRVVVQYGKPFRFEQVTEASRGQQQAAANEILRRITVLYHALAKEKGIPALAAPAQAGSSLGARERDEEPAATP
jgi:1-acyl-sn-glycerol-3-phosphate acyltransferase